MIPVNVPLTLPFRLAWRELRGGVRGFRIFLACLILGVAAIAGVRGVSDGVLHGLRNDGRAILGGDISIRMLYTGLNNEQMAYLSGFGHVMVTAETQSMARRADNDRTSVVELKAVGPEYPVFGQIRLIDAHGALVAEHLQDLLRPDEAGRPGAVVQRMVLDRLDLDVGDDIALGDQVFVVRGIIDREPDLAGSAGIILGPRMMIAMDALQATGLVRTGSMIYWNYRLVLDRQYEASQVIAQINADWPENGWRIRDYTHAAPRVERFTNRLAQFLTLVGLTSLLVGGVGVGNAVNAFLTGKMRVIAVIKCLGAPGRLVFRTYLIQVMILGVLGVLAGALLGAILPFVLSGPLNAFLPVSFHPLFQPLSLLQAVLFGLATALVFSLWPIGRARETAAADLFRDQDGPKQGYPRLIYIIATLVSALLLVGLVLLNSDDLWFAGWFVAGALTVLLLFRAIGAGCVWLAGRIKGVRRPSWRLAIANLHRPGNPTAHVILSLGLGLTVLVSIAQIEGNFSRALLDDIPQDAPAYFFVDIQPDQIDDLSDRLGRIQGAHGLILTPMVRGHLVRVNGRPPQDALVDPRYEWVMQGDRGLTYTATQPANSVITEGKWWPPEYTGKPILSVASDVARAFDIGVGDHITVDVLGNEITAEIANVRDIDWGRMTMNFALTFAPGALEDAPMTYLGTINADDYPAERAIQKLVAEEFSNVTAVHIRNALETVNDILGSIAMAVRLTAMIALAAGMLVLAGAIAAGRRRRVYEAVILKVLGATRRDIMFSYMLEYGALGLVAAVLAVALGAVSSWAVLTYIMHVPWRFLWVEAGLTAGLGVLITLILGFTGTWRSLGQKAVPMLRNE